MNVSILLLIPILFPIVAGGLLWSMRIDERKKRERFVAGTVITNAIITGIITMLAPSKEVRLLSLNTNLQVVLKLDQFGMVFALLVSVLWIVAVFYAFEYMKHEGKETRFLAFYMMTLGVTLGIAFSGNALTMYLFYELLTLVTCPLVCHSGTKEAITALRYYVAYSLGSAALALVGLVGVFTYSGNMGFLPGGALSGQEGSTLPLGFFFLCMFFGFGMKAAILPLHGWLPRASVAPTPVTALLHAVAVVKAGVFAVTRVVYYLMGTEILRGSRVQEIAMIVCIATILYGSTKAVFTKHLKRRLAFSTISQLSYILLGMMLITPEGFSAGLLHLVAHAVAKITLFYCAGAILYKTGKEYVWELTGIGRKMPVTMTAFLIASLSLAGIPPLSGFFSKWYLLSAAIRSQGTIGRIGAVALIISAFLTAIYLFSTCIRAFISAPEEGEAAEADGVSGDAHHKVEDPNWYMKAPLVLLSVVTLVFGLFAAPLAEYFTNIMLNIPL